MNEAVQATPTAGKLQQECHQAGFVGVILCCVLWRHLVRKYLLCCWQQTHFLWKQGTEASWGSRKSLLCLWELPPSHNCQKLVLKQVQVTRAPCGASWVPLLGYHQKLPRMAWPHFLCFVSKKTSKPAELCQFPLQLLNGGLVSRFLLSYRMIGALHEMSEIPLSASRTQNTWADSFSSFNHGLLYNLWKGNCSFLE